MSHDKPGPRELALRMMREKRAERAEIMKREASKLADKYIGDPKRSRITKEEVTIGRPVFAKRSKKAAKKAKRK